MLYNIVEWVWEPLSYPFMLKAMLVAVLVAIVCAFFSCFLVLKSWSLMGDAISHAVLPGVVLAYMLHLPLAIGAFCSGMLCAFLTGFLKEKTRIKEDSVMGIVFSTFFAIGILLISQVKSDVHLKHIIFGDILGITQAELIQSVVISLGVLLVLGLKYKDFLLYCFDPSHARVVGLSTRVLHYALLSLLSLTIVSAMQVVGVILVVAWLIAPGITAFILSKRFEQMMVIAIVVSVVSSVFGVLLSYHLDAATGPTIVLLQSLIFVLALSFKKWQSASSLRLGISVPKE